MKVAFAISLFMIVACATPQQSSGHANVVRTKVNPIISLCGKSSAQARPILGEGTEGTLTWTYQGTKHTIPEMHYQVGDFKDVALEFGPSTDSGKDELLRRCTARFPKQMGTWQEAFKFLGLSTEGAIKDVEGQIASNLVGPDEKPSKRLVFKHVKGLDRRYIMFIDLSSKDSKLELDFAVDSGFSTVKMWSWFWDKDK